MSLITVVTCDRPTELTSCLDSVAAALADHAPGTSLLVCDDSRNPSSASANRRIAMAVRDRYGISVSYAGSTEKTRLNEDLGAPHALRFALEGMDGINELTTTSGRNRNAALLLSAGQRLISVDDDTTWRFSKLSPEVTGVHGGKTAGESGRSVTGVLRGRGDRATTPADGTTVPRHLPEASFNEGFVTGPLADAGQLDRLMLPYCGNPIEELLGMLDYGAGNGTTDEGMEVCSSAYGRRARVAIAMTGIRGNRWYHQPALFLRMGGPLRDRVYHPRSMYRAARRGVCAVQQAADYFVTAVPFLVGACHAIDTRRMVPPFLPAGRAAEWSLGHLLQHCYPEMLIAHLPFCVHHDLGPARPLSDRHYADVTPSFGVVTRLILLHAMRSSARSDLARPHSSNERLDAAESLISVGRRLSQLASLPHGQWLELTHELCIAHARGETTLLEEILQEYRGQPPWWAADVREHIDRLISSLALPGGAIPRELRDLPTLEAATALHRDFCREYGELLTCWPEIWGRAVAVSPPAP